MIFKMEIQLKRMDEDELVRKILEGERDFSGIILKWGYLSDHGSFQELQKYLEKQKFQLEDAPIVFDDSILTGIRAFGLYLPHVRARRANLRTSYFEKAILDGADFTGADLAHTFFLKASLVGANLYGTNLQNAVLSRADLWGADLRTADLDEALLYGTNFRGADIRGVRNFGKAMSLEYAIWYKPVVTPTEKKLIIDSLEQIEFDVRT